MIAQLIYAVNDIKLPHVAFDDLNDNTRTTALILAKSDYYRQVRFPLRIWIERILNEAEFRNLQITKSTLSDLECTDVDHIIFWRLNTRTFINQRDYDGRRICAYYKEFKQRFLNRYSELNKQPRELEYYLLKTDWQFFD